MVEDTKTVIKMIEAWLAIMEDPERFPRSPSCFPLEFTKRFIACQQRDIEGWINHMCDVNFDPVSPVRMKKTIEELKEKNIDISEYVPFLEINEKIYMVRMKKRIGNLYLYQTRHSAHSSTDDLRRILKEAEAGGVDAAFIERHKGYLPQMEINRAMVMAKLAVEEWPAIPFMTKGYAEPKEVYGLISEAGCLNLSEDERNLLKGIKTDFIEKRMRYVQDLRAEGSLPLSETKKVIFEAESEGLDASKLKEMLPAMEADYKIWDRKRSARSDLSWLENDVPRNLKNKRAQKEELEDNAARLIRAKAEIEDIASEGIDTSDLKQRAAAIAQMIVGAGWGIAVE